MRTARPLALALAAGLTLAPSSLSLAAVDLPLSRVTVYRSGVAAFTHEGRIEDDATLSLDLSPGELSDALKSLVATDEDASSPPSASYAPHRDLDAKLSRYDLDPRQPLPSLLESLRGERVRVRTPDGEIEGALFGVETIPNPENGVQRQHVTLLTERGFRTVDRSQILTVDFLDEEVARNVREALAALVTHRDEDEATLEIRFEGNGARRAMATYVHAAPVWKTSYRLVMPDDDGGEALLQAWAVVENQTDRDWSDVTLTVAAGQPVSFTMDLQTPFTPARPEVTPPYAASAGPTEYERDLFTSQRQALSERMEAEAMRRMRSGSAASMADGASPTFAMAPNEVRESMASQASAAGLEAGSQFVFTFDEPVTLSRGASAMLPLASEAVSAELVSIYSASTGATPMRGARLTNDTGLDLMPGPIAVYDAGHYAGDAQIGHVSDGEDRLLSFAADLDLLVTQEGDAAERVASVRLVDGVLLQRVIDRRETTYRVVNRDQDRPRTVLIEHPRLTGWTLGEGAKPVDESASTHRFEVEVGSGGAESLTVDQTRPRLTRHALGEFDPDVLLTLATDGDASDEVMEALREASRLHSRVRQLERRIAAQDARLEEIERDQRRIRENMGRLGQATDLWRRYAGKLAEQEDEIETILEERDERRAELEAARAELSRFITGLSVE